MRRESRDGSRMLMIPGVLGVHMSQLDCPECGRDLSLHQLDTQTIAQRNGFETTYRCPFCRADVGDLQQHLA